TLAPLTLSLLGTAGVLRKGRTRDYALAGLGLGLACASKYTAGIVLVPFAAAVAARYLDGEAGAARRTLGAIALTAAVALLAFLGLQGRCFGRWLLPIFPILCLLAAFFALRASRALATAVGVHERGRTARSARAPGRAPSGTGLARVAAVALAGLLVAAL